MGGAYLVTVEEGFSSFGSMEIFELVGFAGEGSDLTLEDSEVEEGCWQVRG
jgi:hypothetical protein